MAARKITCSLGRAFFRDPKMALRYTIPSQREFNRAKITTKGKYLIRIAVFRLKVVPVTVKIVSKAVPKEIQKADMRASFPQLI